MVGSGVSGFSHPSGGDISGGFSLALSRMDVAWSRLGLDKHEDYSRILILPGGYADRTVSPLARERSHGSALKVRPGQLSCCSPNTTSISSEKTILRFMNLSGGVQWASFC